MNTSNLHFTFNENSPERLDKFLVTRIPELSRARIQALITAGHITINDDIPHKSGFALATGDQIEVRIPPAAPSQLIPEAIPLDILFENDDVFVVNKPAGMVVHPAAGHASGTLIHAALAHAPEIEGVGGEKRPGLVHRLDKDTSGAIIMAKNDRAQHWLSQQFQDRQVGKNYLALVDGQPPTPTGRVEAPIGRDPAHRQRMAVTTANKGREAISEFFTLESFDKHTLLEVHIHTGRTHQIRLHLAFLECPVVGDTVYGRNTPSLPLQRQFLHAQWLSIVIPGEAKARTFEAPLPNDLSEILEQLRLG